VGERAVWMSKRPGDAQHIPLRAPEHRCRLVARCGAHLVGRNLVPEWGLQVFNLPFVSMIPDDTSHYLLGGLFIGAGVGLLFLLTGLVGGMSTVFSSTWSFVVRRPFFQQPRLLQSREWRLAYSAGLIGGAAIWWFVFGDATRVAVDLPWWRLLVGGVIAGYGARLSQGCTSGHGVCGLASLKLPSLAAVLTFMATAMLTANAAAWLLGAP
jgi:uncharacterized protein